MIVSSHYLKKCSRNPIQTWCVHLLGRCSELIRFWLTLAKCWPSSGQKMTENSVFQLSSLKKNINAIHSNLCGITITRYNSNMVLTLVRRVFTNDCNWFRLRLVVVNTMPLFRLMLLWGRDLSGYFRTNAKNGPFTRCSKLRAAHAMGMPGTFLPPLTSKETAR